MSADPPTSGNPPRSRLALSLTLIALAVALVGFVVLRRPSAPAGPGDTAAALEQHDTSSAATPPPLGGVPGPEEATPATAPASADKPSPAPLVAGNPLTDDRFAEISTGIVIAAIGLKQNADWAANVEAYMAQQLDKAGVTQAQYNEYAQALHEHPERGQAVAENIMRRVQKKVGYHIGIEKLPMFKFDERAIKAMQEKLKH